MKIAVIGGKNTGKTTLAKELQSTEYPEHQIIHTDDFQLKLLWKDQSELTSKCFDLRGKYIIEGLPVVRALRKWLERNPNPTSKPVHTIFYCSQQYQEEGENFSPQEKATVKAVNTIFEEISQELINRGVEIEEIPQ